MRYGVQIGKKFEKDGLPRRYPGNTVIADVLPGSGAYEVMRTLKERALADGLGDMLILLPEDSYHMTVLRGLNDQVRTDAFWPASLAKDAPMTKVDDYITDAVHRIGLPDAIRMRFAGIRFDDEDLRVQLVPADEEQRSILRSFRDAAAREIGLFLPGHEDYTYHITLAYTRMIPEGEKARTMEECRKWMEAYSRCQPSFETTPPYVAYYDDMLVFSPSRIPRE